MSHLPSRNSDPSTSLESASAVGALAAKLRATIVPLVRAAGPEGLTGSEIAALIPEHKPCSITPRLIELVEDGLLVRVFLGTGKPTKRSPAGAPRYVTRFDTVTRRNVLVHFAPEFASNAVKKPSASVNQPELPYGDHAYGPEDPERFA